MTGGVQQWTFFTIPRRENDFPMPDREDLCSRYDYYFIYSLALPAKKNYLNALINYVKYYNYLTICPGKMTFLTVTYRNRRYRRVYDILFLIVYR